MLDNPLLYRARLAARRSPLRMVLARLMYPALVATPLCMSAKRDVWLFALILHFIYFAAAPLMRTLRLVSSERVRGTWDTLVGTGWTRAQQLATLAWLALAPLLFDWLVSGLALHWISERTVGTGDRFSPLILWPYTLVCLLFFASAGLAIAVRARTAGAAYLQAWGLLLWMFLGSLVVDIVIVTPLLNVKEPICSAVCCPFLYGLMVSDSHFMPWPIAPPLVLAFATLIFVWSAYRGLGHEGARTLASGTRFRKSRFESPLLYRMRLEQGKSLTRSLLAYPLIVLAPLLASRHWRGDVESSVLLMHGLYVSLAVLLPTTMFLLRERERQTWESLVTTGITSRTVVQAIAVGIWLPVALSQLLYAPLWLLLVPGVMPGWPAVAGFVVLTQVWLFFTACLGLYLSVRSERSSTGVGWAFGILMSAIFGAPMAGVVTGLNTPLFMLSPAYALSCIAEPSMRHAPQASFCVVFYAVVAVLLLLASWRRLRKSFA